MAKDDFEIVGMKSLENLILSLEKMPQSIPTQAAKAGAKIVFRSAKLNAPQDEGNLKKGIILKKQRKTKAGKAVYNIMMDPSKGSLFVKVGANGNRSYYPASQEYGYLTVDGQYIPGYRYFRHAIENNVNAVELAILEKGIQQVEKIMQKEANKGK